MQDSEDKRKSILIIPILKESLSLYKDNFLLFFSISLIGYALFLFGQSLAIFNISFGWFESIIFLLGSILNFWAMVALILAVSKKHLNEDIDVKQSFVETKSKIGRFIGVTILGSLIFIAGSLLLVIPGMYWGTIFSLAGIVLVLENTAFFESFKRSKNLIQDSFWPIFGFYLLLFLVFSLTWLIYRIDLSMIAKTWLMYLTSILSAPWGVAININIYNRLKKVKGEIRHPEDKEIKKGVGCLGCMGMIGLVIAVIILSTIWFKNLGGFIETEKWSKAYEWVAKQVSPKMEFPDGVTLKRPKGYLVAGGHQEVTTYVLNGFLDKDFFSFSASSIPYDKMSITDASSIKLGDGEIWDKYYAYLTNQSPSADMEFKNMEKDSLEIINIAGRPWAQCILKEKEREYAKTREVWVYNYTLSDSAVIFVSYSYAVGKDSKGSIAQTQEVNKILSGFSF